MHGTRLSEANGWDAWSNGKRARWRVREEVSGKRALGRIEGKKYETGARGRERRPVNRKSALELVREWVGLELSGQNNIAWCVTVVLPFYRHECTE